jgi:anti-anti-sigma regulatory factor
VTCRLDVSREPGRVVVRIHGRLDGAAVRELERVCREEPGLLILELTHLMSADDAGIATLRHLAVEGAHLTSMSPYVALLLGLEDS